MRRAASLALGMLGNRDAVEPLGRALADSDRGVRLAADDSFRALLVRNAAPLHHQQLLKVMHLNDGGEHAAALAPTMILVDQSPRYTEAHHQLAICWHGLENHHQAELAYRACLWNCRYHYPAWQGLAKCRVLMGDSPGAIERAHALFGDLSGRRDREGADPRYSASDAPSRSIARPSGGDHRAKYASRSVCGETELSYDESLVGALSIFFAVTAAAVAVGPWSGPYQLRSIALVEKRFGKSAARGVWVALAIALLTAGIAILSGVRPSYAVPDRQVDLNH